MDEFPILWEDVSTNNSINLLRLKVPGGWLVVTRDSVHSQSSTSFVSDPQWTWVLES